MKFYAHTKDGRTEDEWQLLEDHLQKVGELAYKFSEKIGLGECGKLIGLLHDLGKYSKEFQYYIKSSEGLIDPDEDDYIDASGKKGKIDHSSAGAQVLFETLSNTIPEGLLTAQVLALCIASHHSGLIDCINPEGVDSFTRRIKKTDEKTNKTEVLSNLDQKVKDELGVLLSDNTVINRINTKFQSLLNKSSDSKETLAFKKGLLARYLLSCLLDADRLNSADFESPTGAKLRNNGEYINWNILINRLNEKLESFAQKKDKNHIDKIRQNISDHCYEFFKKPRGLYQLTVPTGGGVW